ncbi:TPA: hypothetical protein ACXNPR_001229 [Enterobacter cancerogenus]
MNSKWVAVSAIVLLSGCVGKARHPQCQNLKGEAFGSQLGAAASGRYIDEMKANVDEARYERCEEMFDLVQYQTQQQQQLVQTQQQQALIQAQQQEQERKALVIENLKGPEAQKMFNSASLKDLVDCERGIGKDSDKFPADLKAVVSYGCEKEINKRVASGKVSRSTVDKMLNQT